MHKIKYKQRKCKQRVIKMYIDKKETAILQVNVENRPLRELD